MSETYERLDAAMEQRRVQLRMSWRDVTRVAEMSYEGLRAIRKGERRPNSVTKARLESALQWEPGSIDAVLAGGDPLPLLESKPVEDLELDRLDALEKMIEAALAEVIRLKRERENPAS